MAPTTNTGGDRHPAQGVAEFGARYAAAVKAERCAEKFDDANAVCDACGPSQREACRKQAEYERMEAIKALPAIPTTDEHADVLVGLLDLPNIGDISTPIEGAALVFAAMERAGWVARGDWMPEPHVTAVSYTRPRSDRVAVVYVNERG